MKIRRMKPEDMERIIAITEAAWNENTIHKLMEDRYGVIGKTGWKQRKVKYIKSLLLKDPEHVIVAVKDGKVVGYAAWEINTEEKTGEVSDNAVDPEYQGRGIGTAMNKWILDLFRKEGMEIARVSTLLHDMAARRVYEKHGFEELARTIHYSMRLANNG